MALGHFLPFQLFYDVLLDALNNHRPGNDLDRYLICRKFLHQDSIGRKGRQWIFTVWWRGLRSRQNVPRDNNLDLRHDKIHAAHDSCTNSRTLNEGCVGVVGSIAHSNRVAKKVLLRNQDLFRLIADRFANKVIGLDANQREERSCRSTFSYPRRPRTARLAHPPFRAFRNAPLSFPFVVSVKHQVRTPIRLRGWTCPLMIADASAGVTDRALTVAVVKLLSSATPPELRLRTANTCVDRFAYAAVVKR